MNITNINFSLYQWLETLTYIYRGYIKAYECRSLPPRYPPFSNYSAYSRQRWFSIRGLTTLITVTNKSKNSQDYKSNVEPWDSNPMLNHLLRESNTTTEQTWLKKSKPINVYNIRYSIKQNNISAQGSLKPATFTSGRVCQKYLKTGYKSLARAIPYLKNYIYS